MAGFVGMTKMIPNIGKYEFTVNKKLEFTGGPWPGRKFTLLILTTK
jgi:hypothetical protein